VKIIELSAATRSLAEYTQGLDEEAIIVTSDGHPVAALVPLPDGRDWDEELSSLGMNPKFLRIIAQAEEEFNAGKKLSFEELSRRLDEE
jgi:antitoxin (DNA-binding transcriptional repressor) of toxin-antitoxin stability system